MFDIGWTELLLIAVVAIVVIGPKDLPRAMRLVGQWTTKMKRMARDFQGQFNEALREAELDTVKKDIEAITKLDPVGDLRKEMTKAGDEIRHGLDTPAPGEKPVKKPESAVPPAAAMTPLPAAETPAAAAAGDAKP